MSDQSCNMGERRDGEVFCSVHRTEKLLERSVYEAKYGKLDQPYFEGVLVCPSSKVMLSNKTAAHDVIEEDGTSLS